MSRNEKLGLWFVGSIVFLDCLRHFTWRKRENISPPFTPIGMHPYSSVRRRA